MTDGPWEFIRKAEIEGRRYCDEMHIESKTALVPCWVLRAVLEEHKELEELKRVAADLKRAAV